MLLGHTKQINGVWKIQSLKQHSEKRGRVLRTGVPAAGT